jgi:hypothetical protein
MTNIPGNQPPQGYPPQPYPPPYPPVVYPPPKKGSSALKIVLIIVAIFVGLGIIGAGIVAYGVYKLAKSGNFTTSTQPVTAADLGVPLYPGAEQKVNVRMTIAGKDTLTATFLTSDSKEQVIAFYQSNLDPSAKFTANNNGGTFMLDKATGDAIVTVSQAPNVEGGKTQIVIVHATKAAATPVPQGGSTN